MTEKEKVIASAYTGYMFVSPGQFPLVHKYIEEKLERPIWTHEFPLIDDEIQKAVMQDFIDMVKAETICCKDCKHKPEISDDLVFPPTEDGIPDHTCPFVWEDLICPKMPPDDFYCGFGERRKDEKV